MDRPTTEKPPLDGNGFFVAAILAPGVSVAIFYLGVALTASSEGPVGGVGGLIGSLLLLLLIVTVWGTLPSLVFGGLVLAGIRRLPWRGRPTAIVLMAGGAAAAGLYVLTGLGVAALSPMAAMFFAPWAMSGLIGQNLGGLDWWLVSSLLLSGAAAGLIYSAFAKRG